MMGIEIRLMPHRCLRVQLYRVGGHIEIAHQAQSQRLNTMIHMRAPFLIRPFKTIGWTVVVIEPSVLTY